MCINTYTHVRTYKHTCMPTHIHTHTHLFSKTTWAIREAYQIKWGVFRKCLINQLP